MIYHGPERIGDGEEMRILLISPPSQSIVKEVVGAAGPPLGLAYLAAVARDIGWDVRIIDGLAEEPSMDAIAREVRRLSPEVVGLTATTATILDAYEVARVVKENSPETLVVIGGPHATFMADEILRECPYIDLVVRGEGEETLGEILKRVERGRGFSDVAGITYREGGVIRENPPRPLISDLDRLPIPAYDLLPMERYQVEGVRFSAIMTSRGCPYNCVFCSSSLQFGRRWRAHSVDRVLEELRLMVEEFKVREIEFLDDTFTLDSRRAVEIARGIVREGLDISWSASSRVNTFNREVGGEMRRAGAHTIYFGIESGSERTLEFIGKGISRRQAMDAVRAAKDVKLNALGSFVIGFPYETEEEVRETIRFANRVGVDLAQFTVATPYPGTRLWEIALRENLLLTRDWRRYTTLDVVMRNIYMTPQRLKSLLLWAYIAFYLHPKRVLKDLFARRGFILRRAVPAAIQYLKKYISGSWE